MVKKCAGARGRPRSFDEAEALRGATKVFWAKGYDGATIDDLVARMGVRRPSLYAIFGDKAALFKRCLEGYGSESAAFIAHVLDASPDVQGAIHAMIRLAVEGATGDKSTLGCLMVSVAPLVDDAGVREYLTQIADQTTRAIARRLEKGIDDGDLPQDFPVEERARMVLDICRALSVRARLGASREELLNDADNAAVLLLRA